MGPQLEEEPMLKHGHVISKGGSKRVQSIPVHVIVATKCVDTEHTGVY